MALDPAPYRPTTPDGTALLGTFRGVCKTSEIVGASRLERLLREKRWQWFAAADRRVAVGGAIVDAGLASTLFVWVFDRRRGELVADHEVLRGPGWASIADSSGQGEVARFGRGKHGALAEVARHADRLRIRARFAGLELDLALHVADHRVLTAICPVDGTDYTGVNLTQKETALRASGRLRCARGLWHLEPDAVGMADYSHGLLARETRWRWAIGSGTTADGRRVGFNLVEDFNAGLENAVWLGDALHAVSPARFRYDRHNPDRPWRVETADGEVDLTLDVHAVRAADADLWLAASVYRQPLGVWSGTLLGEPIADVFGVAEDHRARW